MDSNQLSKPAGYPNVWPGVKLCVSRWNLQGIRVPRDITQVDAASKLANNHRPPQSRFRVGPFVKGRSRNGRTPLMKPDKTTLHLADLRL